MTSTRLHVGIVVGLFGLVGVGIGLSGTLFLGTIADQLGSGANPIGQVVLGVLFLGAILTTFFTGPTVGGLSGLLLGFVTDDERHAMIAAGVGSFVGFIVMTSIAVLVMSSTLGSAGGASGGATANLGQYATQIVAASIPTTLVGAAAAALGVRL